MPRLNCPTERIYLITLQKNQIILLIFLLKKNGKNIYLSNSDSVPQWFDEFLLKKIDREKV